MIQIRIFKQEMIISVRVVGNQDYQGWDGHTEQQRRET